MSESDVSSRLRGSLELWVGSRGVETENGNEEVDEAEAMRGEGNGTNI